MSRVIKFVVGITSLLLGLLLLARCALIPPHIPVPATEDHVISNVTIYNPSEPVLPNQTIIVRDGIITDIRPTVPSDGPALCENCFAMPGLIDAHVHTPPKLAIGNQKLFSLLYLKYGVTSVRDLGQIDNSTPKLAARLNAGKIAGPRMYRCGRILDGDSPTISGARSVVTREAGIMAVKDAAQGGVDCIKVYTYLPADAFEGVALEAERQNLPLVGHTPHAVNLSAISNFESQHFTGIPYIFREPTTGWDYKSTDLLEMDSAEIAKIVQIMRTGNISFLPTTANGFARLTVADPDRFPPTAGAAHLPKVWSAIWPNIVSHAQTDDEIETDLRGIKKTQEFIRTAHEGGIDILVGSDVLMPYVIPGESLHLQIGILADAFGDLDAALMAATKINGAHIDPGKVGRIIRGAHADILLLQNDPRETLDAVLRWEYLLVGGRLYARQEIDAAVEKYDRHFNSGFYNSVMQAAYSMFMSEEGHRAGEGH